MAYFSWTDEMSVGNRFIDADHRKMIDIVNRLHDAMRARKGNDVLEKVLFDLFVYTKGHFQREEEQMKAIGFAGLDAHRQEHELLLRQVTERRQEYLNGKPNMSIEIAEFLRSWLMGHIVGSDMALGAAISKAA
jgi:hemerythrin